MARLELVGLNDCDTAFHLVLVAELHISLTALHTLYLLLTLHGVSVDTAEATGTGVGWCVVHHVGNTIHLLTLLSCLLCCCGLGCFTLCLSLLALFLGLDIGCMLTFAGHTLNTLPVLLLCLQGVLLLSKVFIGLLILNIGIKVVALVELVLLLLELL